jgi:L-rhamnose-H+ transport protein
LENVTDAPVEEMAELGMDDTPRPSKAPMTSNYLLSALAAKYLVFSVFFYTMGETQMGRYKFSSWTLPMASVIIFSTLWGMALKEWHTHQGIRRPQPPGPGDVDPCRRIWQ